MHTSAEKGLFSKIKGAAQGAGRWANTHKLWAGALAVVMLGAGWYVYGKTASTSAEVRYTLGTAAKGSIVSTVSASGQVSASRQVDIKPEVSGAITYVGVRPGQIVTRGTLIASIDTATAQKALRDAQTNLETAELSLEKILAPASGLTLLQAQNSLTNAEDSLAQSYVTLERDITETYLAMPEIMTSLQSIVTGTASNTSGQWNIDYYKNATLLYDDKAIAYREDAYQTYLTAKTSYDKAFAAYQTMGKSPDHATLEQAATLASTMTRDVAVALKSMNTFLQFYKETLSGRNQTVSSTATTALSNLSSHITTTNGNLDTLTKDLSSIKSYTQSIAEKRASLTDLNDGPDTLDVRSAQLTVQQRKDAVTDAQTELAKHYVRAPFGGTIASVDAYTGDLAGSAALATIITPQQIATLSVNEVDASKIKTGQKATLTFDAIEELTLTGTVAQIDPVGTVSQGVVSYEVQIAFDVQDERVKPGMTVNAALQTGVRQDVIVVPTSAIKTQNGASYVLVFDPPLEETGGTQGVTAKTAPQQRPVTLGLASDTEVEITAGLQEGEQLVVRTTSGSTSTVRTTTTSNTRGGFGVPGAAIRL